MDKLQIKSERNYGIELLRILAIVFVLILHILGRGGIYPYTGSSIVTSERAANYAAAWTLETMAFGAVDLFALISGFVGLYATFKFKKWLRLWVLVVFWGVVIFFLFDKCTFIFEGFNALLCKIIPVVEPEVERFAATWADYKDVIFTIGTKQFWYFNMYTMLFIFMPILNEGLKKLGKKQLALMSLVLFLSASVYKTIFNKDLFVMGGGYSAMWLIIMYVFGATAKKYYDDGFRPSKIFCLVGFFVCVGISAGFRFLYDYLYSIHPENEKFHEINDILISYTGPFIVIGCVLLLLLFMQINLKTKAGKKITLFFSAASFGIYIIHVHTAIWDNFLSYRFFRYAYESTPKMLLYILITLILLYFFFAAFEIARIYLFKLTRFDKLIDLCGDGITKLTHKLFIDRVKKKASAVAATSDDAPTFVDKPKEH